ncbi:MAG TPA: nuclear transport factor 2 family protein [Burkholderiales bacterium]|jgi:ketosteroid isomerase-like protein|nr:nuclear transport factor 2 family protein [Burkholderiales bacterium]
MTKDELRKLEDRRYKAMCDADAKALDELLADSLVYTHSYGGADSKASYLDGIRSKKWQYRKIERPQENIQLHGDCAVVTGQVRIELMSEGKPKTLNSAYTNVWIRGTKGWQMVAWQSTPLPA